MTGPMFQTLHTMFTVQYANNRSPLMLFPNGYEHWFFPAPSTYKEFIKLSSIEETEGVLSAHEMIHQLVTGQEVVARTARKVFAIASKADDQPMADVLTQRLQMPEKTTWMLSSLLADD